MPVPVSVSLAKPLPVDPTILPMRRMNLADAMIVVAAVAAGFALARAAAQEITGVDPARMSPAVVRFSRLLGGSICVAAPCLAALSVAALAMRIQSPRPPLRALIRQPGAVATMTATASAIACAFVVVSFPSLVLGQRPSLVVFALVMTFYEATTVGFAWLALRVQGPWRSDPHWVDRLGRGVGACWIALAAVAGLLMAG